MSSSLRLWTRKEALRYQMERPHLSVLARRGDDKIAELDRLVLKQG